MQGSSRETRIKRWLMRLPQPALVNGEYGDGTEKKVRLTSGRYKWADAARALEECVKLCALDKDGSELRTVELGPNDDNIEAIADEAKSQHLAELGEFRSMLACEVPALIKHVADAIAQASKTSAEQHSQGYKSAFEALLGVVQAQGKLAATSINDQLKLLRALQDAKGDGGDVNDQMFMQLLMGQQTTQQPGPPGFQMPNGFNLDPQMMLSLAQNYIAQHGAGGTNGAPNGG